MKEIILTTNTKTSAEAVNAIKKAACKKFGTDKITHITDDRIIGGFTIRFDGMFYDMSIASQLSRLRASVNAGQETRE